MDRACNRRHWEMCSLNVCLQDHQSECLAKMGNEVTIFMPTAKAASHIQ